MHPETQLNTNPCAAPADTAPAVESVAWHGDFQLMGKWIHCRSGVRLLEICFATGEQQQLVALPAKVYAVRKSRLWVRRVGLFFPVVVPMGVIVLMNSLKPDAVIPAATAAGAPTVAVLPVFTSSLAVCCWV
ncbi:MAG: hypothetical protein ACKO2P_20775 [Planctomycetota bacterium]